MLKSTSLAAIAAAVVNSLPSLSYDTASLFNTADVTLVNAIIIYLLFMFYAAPNVIVPVPPVNVVYFSFDPTVVLSVPVVNPEPTVIL